MKHFRMAAVVAGTLSAVFLASQGHAFEPPRMVYVPAMPVVQMPPPIPVPDRLTVIPRAVEAVPQMPEPQVEAEE